MSWLLLIGNALSPTAQGGDLGQDRHRDFLRRDGAEIETGGRLDAIDGCGLDAFADEFVAQCCHLAAAADKGMIGGVGGGCRLQRSLVALALRRHHDEPSRLVEPVLPHPALVILGVSPVALSLAAQARQLGYHVTVAAPTVDLPSTPDADSLIDGFALGRLHEARRFIVVSTQGRGDEAALRATVSTDAAYHAFVGSRRKFLALRDKLIVEGIIASALDRIKAPAGLDLGAITPEEIAMSILAEITTIRRQGQRIPISNSQDINHADER